MSVEGATYINSLNKLWPLGSDFKLEGDDHIRLIKAVLQAQFPNFGLADLNWVQRSGPDRMCLNDKRDGSGTDVLTYNRTTGFWTAPGGLTLTGNLSATNVTASASVSGSTVNGSTQVLQGGLTNWVAQGNLKTVLQQFNTATTYLIAVLSGGEYSLGLVTWSNVNEAHLATFQSPIEVVAAYALKASNTVTGGTSYFVIGRQTTGTVWCNARYVQASPPYDMGDGLVELFVYALIDKASGNVLSAWSAEDPPWAYNGPTTITPDVIGDDGKQYRRVARTDPGLVGRAAVEAFLRAPIDLVEIDAAFKNSDMALIPHPYIGDPAFLDGSAEAVLLDPQAPIISQLAAWQRSGGSVLDLIHKDGVPADVVIGNTPLKRAGPQGLKIVEAKWR